MKEAQSLSKEVLLEKWVLNAIEGYMITNNPLGLVDSFIAKLSKITTYELSFLRPTYDYLAAAYRYYYATNQLEFVWDGRSHLVKYTEEWETQFNHWTYGLALQDPINRSLLKACVLRDGGNYELLQKNFTRLVLAHLRLKWDGRKKSLEKIAS